MSARAGMRFSAAALRQNFQPQVRMMQRRFQSTAASSDATATQAQGSYMQRLWNSEVGPKTVHFWAPIMKVRYPYLATQSWG